MQQTLSDLAQNERVTFGFTDSGCRSLVAHFLNASVLCALAFQYAHDFATFPFSVIVSGACWGGAFIFRQCKSTIEFDFGKKLYFISTGSGMAAQIRGGRFSDIRCLSVTRNVQVQASTFQLIAHIEFMSHSEDVSYRLDSLFYSVSTEDINAQMILYLDLAARLNVPLRDDSGWNGWQSPTQNPQVFLIPPGETHPALLLPPPPKPKWNKW